MLSKPSKSQIRKNNFCFKREKSIVEKSRSLDPGGCWCMSGMCASTVGM